MLKASQPFTAPSQADLAILAAVIRDVSRLHRLSDADAQDFAQTVHLRLIERRYDAFARFDGRSSLRSYLTVVVTRLLLDWRNALYGKWRPSAAARRLGPAGIELDRLINRDGYTPDEAVELVRRRMRAPTAHFRELADRVPRRGRRSFVDDDILRTLAMEGFHDPIEASEHRTAARRSSHALARACRQLPADDRKLIALRYQRSMTVQQIGKALHINPKLLYRRFDRTLRLLRSAMDAAGIHIGDCRSAIAD
jgi:RNA polymerase sigma factor for flagellar operon FliA